PDQGLDVTGVQRRGVLVHDLLEVAHGVGGGTAGDRRDSRGKEHGAALDSRVHRISSWRGVQISRERHAGVEGNETAKDRLVLHGSCTSSSTYKPMLFLALAGLPFSFRTVNLKIGVQKQPAHLAINRYGQVPVLQHRGLTLVMSNVILDYLARTTGKFEGSS